MYDMTHLRQTEFPISQNYIYFNHASISPLPTRSKKAMLRAVEELARQPINFWVDHGNPMNDQLKAAAAAFINAASPQEIVPITTTSAGLNNVAQAMAWQPGDNVAFYEHEFPANAYPWMSLGRDGVEVRLVPGKDGGLTVAELEPLVDGRTRVVTVSAIQFFSGHKADLAALGRFCRERGIHFIVDAIQAIGHMKIDVQAMHIDALATGGQKSILSTPGTGILYVRDAFAETLRPRHIHSNATQDFLHWLAYDLAPRPGADRFMAGTANLPGLFATHASLELLAELGIENIDRHTTALADAAMELLGDMGYEIVTPAQAHGPIVTFKSGLDSEAADALIARFRENKVAVVKHLDAAGEAYVRLSFHCYNTLAELERFGQIFTRLRN